MVLSGADDDRPVEKYALFPVTTSNWVLNCLSEYRYFFFKNFLLECMVEKVTFFLQVTQLEEKIRLCSPFQSLYLLL